MIRIEAFTSVHPQEGHEDAKCDHFLDDFQIGRCEFADFARSGDNPRWNVGLFFTTGFETRSRICMWQKQEKRNLSHGRDSRF
jgi:hypothetical protein